MLARLVGGWGSSQQHTHPQSVYLAQHTHPPRPANLCLHSSCASQSGEKRIARHPPSSSRLQQKQSRFSSPSSLQDVKKRMNIKFAADLLWFKIFTPSILQTANTEQFCEHFAEKVIQGAEWQHCKVKSTYCTSQVSAFSLFFTFILTIFIQLIGERVYVLKKFLISVVPLASI